MTQISTITSMEVSDEGSSRGMATIFAALSNPERVAILEALASPLCTSGERGASITEIAARIGQSRFAASRHLRILSGAGLVSVEQSRRTRHHRLVEAGMIRIEDWVCSVIPADGC